MAIAARQEAQLPPSKEPSYVMSEFDATITPDILGDNKHGYIIHAVFKLLEDGRFRSTDEILDAGLAAGLLPKTLSRKSLYIHIIGYIQRQQAAGRRSLIIQDPKNRYFRLDRPSDSWPAFHSTITLPSESDLETLIQRLEQTSKSDNPTEFELSACDAFAALGFLTKHIGGYAAPDARVDAPLGPQAFTATIECESAQSGLVRRIGGVVEAAQHRDDYKADYCVLLGPAFEKLGALDAELQKHSVALWTVSDLITVLRLGFNPFELRVLFNAGRAENKLDDLLWQRDNGETKRVRTIADVVIEQGWKLQVLAAKEGPREQAPLLNIDAVMMLVDTWLEQQGSTTGCSREEVRAAFSYLTNPLVGKAVYTDDRLEAIVLTSPRPL